MIRNISHHHHDDDDITATDSPATTPFRPSVTTGPRINVLAGMANPSSDKTAWKLTERTLLDRRTDPMCDNTGTTNASGKNYCNAFRTIAMSLCLMSVLVVQGATLNYFLIYFNSGQSEWYFLFLADFVILVTFGFAITFAWRYYERVRREHLFHHPSHHSEHHDPHDAQIKETKRVGARLLTFSFPKPMGMLPLIYVCWIMYAVTLVVKLYILYFLDIPQQMVEGGFRTPKEYILIALSGSVCVFFFWVEIHWLIGDEVHKRLSKPSVDDLIGHTMFEIFDSLNFLDLITPDDRAEMDVDRRFVSTTMKTMILLFASVNFILPFLGLYRLSRTHFGEKTNGMIRVVDELTGKPTTRGLGISITYHIMRLIGVNIPFLIIRFSLSSHPTKELSVFAVKNILGILTSVRNLVPEIQQLIRISKFKRNLKLSRIAERFSNHRSNPSNETSSGGNDQSGWEMPALFSSSNKSNEPKQTGLLQPATLQTTHHRGFSIDSDEISVEDVHNVITETTRTSSSSTNVGNTELNDKNKF